MPILERHEDKWQPEPNTGCHIWTGYIRGTPEKRPAIRMYGKNVNICRFVCEEVNGPPPTDKHEAAHKRHCSGGLCVYGGHLYWATHRENMMDVPVDTRMRISLAGNPRRKK